MNTPKISVVMCAYNAEAYLEPALQSILQQTFSDFEFIIVDDGSTDQTASILADYARRDARIIILTNDANLSVPRATNRGFAAARGEYIARMDSDDIAAPVRFEKQVRYLDANHECVVVGTGYQEINEREQILKTDCDSVTSPLLHWRSLFRMPFVHSSIMFRRNVIRKNGIEFDPAFDGAADFDFTQRLLRVGRAAIIPEPLMQYRMHPLNVSTRRQNIQRDAAKRASIRETQRLFPVIETNKLERLFHYIHADSPLTLRDTLDASHAMQELQTSFAQQYNLSNREARRQSAHATRWLAMTILRRQRLFGSQLFLVHFLVLRRSVWSLISETVRFAGNRLHRFRTQNIRFPAWQK